MALEFPASPIDGQRYDRWTYDGEKWVLSSSLNGFGVPAGSIIAYAGLNAPAGWLLCQGQTVSRTLYPDLFAAIGTTWGAGDGSTFVLPSLMGRTPVGHHSGDAQFGTFGAYTGAQTHTLTEAEMPVHNHPFYYGGDSEGFPYTDDANNTSGGIKFAVGTTSYGNVTIGNRGSGGPHNNIQPSTVVNYMIKTANSTVVGTEPQTLFQTHTERNAYFALVPPAVGQRCYVRQCEFIWSGTAWRAVQFVQSVTVVTGPDSGTSYSRGLDITYQVPGSHLVLPSVSASNAICTMADPAGYNSAIEVRWDAYNVPVTWRFEVIATGFLDGYS